MEAKLALTLILDSKVTELSPVEGVSADIPHLSRDFYEYLTS
jgi:hypothetical protein